TAGAIDDSEPSRSARPPRHHLLLGCLPAFLSLLPDALLLEVEITPGLLCLRSKLCQVTLGLRRFRRSLVPGAFERHFVRRLSLLPGLGSRPRPRGTTSLPGAPRPFSGC